MEYHVATKMSRQRHMCDTEKYTRQIPRFKKKKKRQGKEQYREYYLILMYKCLQRQYLCNDTQEAGGDGCLCGKEVRLEFGVGSRLTFHFYTF